VSDEKRFYRRLACAVIGQAAQDYLTPESPEQRAEAGAFLRSDSGWFDLVGFHPTDQAIATLVPAAVKQLRSTQSLDDYRTAERARYAANPEAQRARVRARYYRLKGRVDQG
jgi:hypothetical protein